MIDDDRDLDTPHEFGLHEFMTDDLDHCVHCDKSNLGRVLHLIDGDWTCEDCVIRARCRRCQRALNGSDLARGECAPCAEQRGVLALERRIEGLSDGERRHYLGRVA